MTRDVGDSIGSGGPAEDELWHDLTEPHPGSGGGVHCSEAILDSTGLRNLIEDEARRLRRSGISPGERVVIAAENCHRAYAGFHGVVAAGATAVPLNVRLHPREIGMILDDIEPSLILFHPDQGSTVEAGLQWSSQPNLRRSPLQDSPSSGPRRSFEWEALADPLTIFTTSGSTGRPKGVMLTATSLLANAAQLLSVDGLDTGERYLHSAPVFHLGDAATGIAAALAGCEHLFLRKFDPAQAADLIRHHVDWTMMVPTMIARVLDAMPERGPVRLRCLLYGGAVMTYHLARRAQERFGPVLLQAYGLSEFPSAATALTPTEHVELLGAPGAAAAWGSVGRPVAGVEIGIDETGEVLLRGRNMMSGYWRNPTATGEVIRDGWLATGDAGSIDADGHLHLSGRVKDMIITGGENVYANEVELAVALVPGVEEVAVLGLPDEDWGERVHAVVFARNPLDPTAVDSALRGSLTPFKRPKSYTILHEPLPRNSIGKIDKRELRERFEEAEGGRPAGRTDP